MTSENPQPHPGTPAPISYRFVVVVAIFVACLITSNITATKVIGVSGLILTAAIVIFPVSYIIGDILTEVYGYARARQVIWLGFLGNFIAVIAIWLGGLLPAAAFWEHQAAYDAILGAAPRILVASFLAYLVGEFTNAYVLAKMKIAMSGRRLWMRTIGSTLVGQGFDSLIFVIVAFAGILPSEALIVAILTQWLVKSAYEAAATPVTYVVVDYLKRKEGLDAYDIGTRFNPLTLSEK